MLCRSLPSPLLAVTNVTAHPSTASVGLPITVLLYNGPLVCGFNVGIKGLTRGQSNLTKSASRGAHSPVRGHPRGSKVVPLNSWGRVSY